MGTVKKCICHNRDFTEVKKYAAQNGYTTVEELQADRFCSCSCGLCVPYIKLMFVTGKTEFDAREPYRKL